MTAADILGVLVKANLASGAAILGVVALRKTARTRFGARLAYGLWLLPLLAGAAVLLPARQVVVVRTAAPMVAAAVRIGHSLRAPSAVAVAAGPRGVDGPALLVGLWLAGVAGAALAMAVLQHRFIMRARRDGVGPAVVGLIAPRILIPRDFAERYSPQEQALVLAHEKAHMARQDSRLNGLVAALQCLGWFNPLVHLAARLMRIDQELACDEAVANRFPDARRAYAEVLMKAQLAVLPLPLGCYWPARSPHPLVERVAMLKRPRIGRARWRAGAVALGCLWAGVGVAAWASQPAQVQMVFRTASVAEESGKAAPSDAKAADAASSPVAEPRSARSAPTPHHSAAVALAEAAPPPEPIQIGLPPPVIEHVLIVNAKRIGQEKILSLLGIRPGDSVTAEKLNAADKALFDSGLFSDWRIQAPQPGSSGDLRLWVKENPPPAPVLRQPTEVWTVFKAAPVAGPPGGANGKDGDASSTAFAMRFDQSFHDEAHHIDLLQGHVIFNGYLKAVPSWRIVCDLLIMPSGPPDEPGVPEKITWEGHVFVDHGDDAARADYAYYDFGSKTLTLTGHVAVDKGRWVVKNDRLVIDAKSLIKLRPATAP